MDSFKVLRTGFLLAVSGVGALYISMAILLVCHDHVKSILVPSNNDSALLSDGKETAQRPIFHLFLYPCIWEAPPITLVPVLWLQPFSYHFPPLAASSVSHTHASESSRASAGRISYLGHLSGGVKVQSGQSIRSRRRDLAAEIWCVHTKAGLSVVPAHLKEALSVTGL